MSSVSAVAFFVLLQIEQCPAIAIPPSVEDASLRNLLQQMLEPDAQKRISADQIKVCITLSVPFCYHINAASAMLTSESSMVPKASGSCC